MIGTCREILYEITLKHGWHKPLPLTAVQRRNLHHTIRTGNYGEKLCAELLPRFGAVKLRDAYIVPALYRNSNGVLIDEETLKDIVTSVRNWHQNHFSAGKTTILRHTPCIGIKQEDMDFIASRRGFKLYKERITMPSIWELKQTLDARYYPKFDPDEYKP